MTNHPQLTDPQARILHDVCEHDRSYSGRATRPVKKLRELGLIEASYVLVPHAIGAWTERWDCKATAKGRDLDDFTQRWLR